MRTVTAIVFAAALASSFATAQGDPDYERVFDEKRAIQKGARVSIRHSMGSVDVQETNDKEVSIKANIEVRGDAAKDFGERIKIEVDANTHPMTIRTRYPDGQWQDLSYSVELRVRIPRGHPVDIANSFGAASIQGLHADVEAKTNNGDLSVRNVEGAMTLRGSFGAVELLDSKGEARVRGNNGAVRIKSHSGGKLEVKNGFGAVDVIKLTGDLEVEINNGRLEVKDVTGSVESRASFGAQRFEGIGGALEVTGQNSTVRVGHVGEGVLVESSFGAVRLDDVGGSVRFRGQNSAIEAREVKGSVEIHSRFGGVKLEAVGGVTIDAANGGVNIRDASGDVRIESSFGNIDVQGVDGDLHVDGHNANLKATGILLGQDRQIDCELQFGLISLTLPASFVLDAKTSFGSIRSQFELSGVRRDHNSERAACTVGNGEMKLTLRTQNGDIRLKRGKAAKKKVH